ncbi:hypothetical protein ACIBG4_32805 [Nonomuraea sp. NPDC050383]
MATVWPQREQGGSWLLSTVRMALLGWSFILGRQHQDGRYEEI